MKCLKSAEVTYFSVNDARRVIDIVLMNFEKMVMPPVDNSDINSHNRHDYHVQFQEPDKFVSI